MSTDAAAITTPSSGKNDYVQDMRFGVLGPIEASEKRRRLSVGGPKQRTVLALLISRAGSAVSTDALVDGVYGDQPPQGARRSVQTYVSNLRGELGEVIEASGSGYVLKADRSEVDALRFEDTVTQAIAVDDPDEASGILRDGLALWRGHPYADVDGFVDLTAERTRLSELRMSAIELRVDTDLERGHHGQLIAELESLTEEHPLRERFRAQQMLALYRCGRQAEALRAYEKTRNYLVDEMGLDPSPDLRDLERRILDQDPALGFETGPTVRHAAILVADVGDPRALSSIDPATRDRVLAHQADAIRSASQDEAGELFAHRGSAIYASFDDVEHAVSAAIATQRALMSAGEPMRMAISVGEVEIPQDAAVQGPPVTRAAQLLSAAHGGQVLLSTEANQALSESGGAGWVVRSLGQHDADGSGEARPVYQLMVEGMERDFPPLRTELLPIPLPIATRGLPGYELREQVGAGAFGVVHRAYQPSVGREVAIKIIRPEYANDPQFIRRFEVEAQLVARLEHPHIVPLHDYWRNPDGAYLVMRWLGGGTLSDVIAARGLSIDEANRLLADIGPALAFAHRRGVVHRDIKPSNVLLDEEGGAYLADFGIAGDVALRGVGSVAQDVQALGALVMHSLGESDVGAVADVLAAAVAGERFTDVESFVGAWEEALGEGDATSQAVGFTPTRNPYKGLSAFGELDAADFHGREAEIEEIIDTLAGHPLVAVVGPSGIGKSSVVRAGMIPALRSGAIPGSDQWLITGMMPGAYPYEELTSALMRVATEMPSDLEEDLRRDVRGLARSVKRYVPEDSTVLLVVDQFEELFTLASEDERAAFLAMLAATIVDERSNVRIVITMRADFFDRPLRFADLGDALRAGTIPISAPSDEALHAIVTNPAAGVGVAFELGLVDHIAGDVKHQPGALPLLEFSLTELFDRRDSDLLTLEAYEASGGVLGALGRRAETTYADLDSEGQEAARETFLRLVNVTDAGRDTRRRVRLTELERLGLADLVLRDFLSGFGDHRLLTFDRDPITRGPTIEVAHEAILNEWPRLAGWIDEHREDLLLRSRLAVAVTDWESSDRSDNYLLTRGRLNQHEAWTVETGLTLSTAEIEFLDASRVAEDHRTAQRRRTRRLVMSGFGVAAVIALILAAAALTQRNAARDQSALAEENQVIAEDKTAEAESNAALAATERQIAEAGELGAAALNQIDTDPERALLLGIESLGKAATPAGINATHSALFNHYAVWTMLNDVLAPEDMPWALHPDGERVLVWEGAGSLQAIPARFALYDTTKPDQTAEWRVDLTGGVPIDAFSAVVWFDDDVALIAINDADINPAPTSSARGVYIVDLETGDTLDTVQFGECMLFVYPAVSDRGRASPLIVSTGDVDEATTQCVPGGTTYQTVRYFPGGVDSTDSIALETAEPFQWFRYTPHATDDGQLIALGTVPDLFVFDANTGRPIGTYEGDRIAISGDGDQLLISQINQGFVELVDRKSGDVIRTFSGEYLRITFSSDDTRFIGSSYDGGVHVFDLSTGTRTHDLRGTHYNPYQVSLADDPDTLLAASNDSGRLFKLGNRSEIPVPMTALGERLESWGYGGHHSAVSVGGGLVYVPFVDSDGTGYRIFDLEDGSVVRKAVDVWRVAAMTPDGEYVVEIPRLETGVTDPDGETAELFGQMQLVDTRTGEIVLVFGSTCGFYGTDLSADIYLPHEDCAEGQLFLPLSDAEFSADGSRLGVDSYDGKPAVFDTGTGELLWHTAPDREFSIEAGVVGLSPDGETFIYSGNSVDSDGETLTAVNVDTGESLGEADQLNPNYEIVYSEDGSRIYTANWAYIIYVYDAETFELVDTLTRGQGGGILDVAARGNLVATVGFDKVVRVQTLDSHELMLELELEVKAENVEFLDDRHLLVVTLSEDAFIFTMDSVELTEIAKQRLTRSFIAEECASFGIDSCPNLDEIRSG
jgi:DNA-binding SARP family transcriptional activator/WD40 repeat protein/tRNA A-37 threonylcarbamoyl transferase component Bud32